jgi:hypothetical protein
MKVRELVAELLEQDQEAEVVHVSGLGWPTFNPLQYTTSEGAKS